MLEKVISTLGSLAAGSLSLGIIVLGKDYRVIFWNEWMEKHSDIKAGDILGQDIFDRFPDIRDRGRDRYITESIEDRKPVLLSPLLHQHLIPLNIVKGNEVYPMFQAVKIFPFLEDVEGAGAIIIIEDLTEQILHEKEIARLNRVLRGIRNVNQFITRVRSEEELFNGACEILVEDIGYAFAWIGLIEEGSFDVKPVGFAGIEPELFEELKARWDDSEYGLGVTGKAIKTGKPQQVDSIQEDSLSKPWQDFTEKTGCQSTCSLPLKADNRVIGAVNVHSQERGVFHGEELSLLEEVTGDVSFAITNLRERQKRKQAEETIQENEEKLAQAVDGNSIPTFIIDNNHTVTHWNTACENLTGISAAEMVGTKKHWLAFYDEERPVLADFIVDGATEEEIGGYYEGKHHKSILAEGAFEGEYFYPNLGENGKWLFFTAAPLRGNDGNITGAIETLLDITERRSTEEQLRQAQKMEAIGTLAGGVAHDFNNILTTIIGNASLALMEVGKDGPLREEIEEIKIAGERAAALTRQLLAFSRKQIIQPKILDLNELLTDIEKMLGRLISEDIDLMMIPGPELWQVEADPGQMEQIIVNLAVNARDVMPKGGKLTIETANVDLDGNYFRKHGIEEEQPGTYVMLALSDTGIGMEKETQEHIFEPFFTTKEQGKGTGLGLSMVYGIAKQNKGFVWVYSEPGQGSTFKVYLPKAAGDEEPEKKEKPPMDDITGSETVLVVEDDDSLRKLARTVLKQRGYKVLGAENGEDALRICKEHEGPIDLMITDVVMPKMSGKETAELLQPLYPQMKVIYMSGYTDNAIVHHGVLAPGLNFIEKPFSPKGLARKVREVLDK